MRPPFVLMPPGGAAASVSVRTDELGIRSMYLQALGVVPEDIVLVDCKADGSAISRPAEDTSG